MAVRANETALLRPASVAIHDHADMTGNLVLREIRGFQYHAGKFNSLSTVTVRFIHRINIPDTIIFSWNLNHRCFEIIRYFVFKDIVYLTVSHPQKITSAWGLTPYTSAVSCQRFLILATVEQNKLCAPLPSLQTVGFKFVRYI